MQFPRPLFAFSALFCAAFPLATRAAAPEPSMFRGNAAHLGVYASSAPTLEALKWRFRSGARFVSSPTVAGGVVFAAATNGKIYALRASSGATLWTYATKGPVASTPAVSGDSVYVASLDGGVYALESASGKLRWRFATDGERRFTAPGIHGLLPKTEMMADPFDVFLSSPAVDGDTVYVGSGDHNVYALDAHDGTLRWKFTTGDVVHASPAVANGTVYIGSWDRYMYALDAKDGSVRWKFQTGDDRETYNQIGIAGSAAVANGTVYFGCRDSFFYALDAQSGALRWKHDQHGSWVIGSPVVANGAVYYTTSDERRLFALDATSGALRFSLKYDAFSFSSPSLAGHTLYFGTSAGMLYAIDAGSGKVVGRFATDGRRRNGARYMKHDGTLNVSLLYTDPTLGGAYVGLDRTFSLGSIVGSPVIAGGRVFVGATDGTLYALE
jgi:eukaryotic-like serine/threonine-protein kinase